jgi:DNA-binding response OmpR family regulator
MNPPPRILLAIADGALRRSVAGHLRNTDAWAVTEAAHMAEALGQAEGQDLAVVDECLDGVLLCRKLRQDGPGRSLILLAAAQTAPLPGIDAVVPKPLRLPVLVSHIRDILARRARAGGMVIGPWRFDEDRSVLHGESGAMVRLTAKETAILGRLHREDGGIVGRDILLGEVWGYGEGIDTHTLETHIYKLRRKLGAGLLLSENGGYRLARRS